MGWGSVPCKGTWRSFDTRPHKKYVPIPEMCSSIEDQMVYFAVSKVHERVLEWFWHLWFGLIDSENRHRRVQEKAFLNPAFQQPSSYKGSYYCSLVGFHREGRSLPHDSGMLREKATQTALRHCLKQGASYKNSPGVEISANGILLTSTSSCRNSCEGGFPITVLRVGAASSSWKFPCKSWRKRCSARSVKHPSLKYMCICTYVGH